MNIYLNGTDSRIVVLNHNNIKDAIKDIDNSKNILPKKTDNGYDYLHIHIKQSGNSKENKKNYTEALKDIIIDKQYKLNIIKKEYNDKRKKHEYYQIVLQQKTKPEFTKGDIFSTFLDGALGGFVFGSLEQAYKIINTETSETTRSIIDIISNTDYGDIITTFLKYTAITGSILWVNRTNAINKIDKIIKNDEKEKITEEKNYCQPIRNQTIIIDSYKLILKNFKNGKNQIITKDNKKK